MFMLDLYTKALYAILMHVYAFDRQILYNFYVQVWIYVAFMHFMTKIMHFLGIFYPILCTVDIFMQFKFRWVLKGECIFMQFMYLALC
jgi:hypothetical protein